MSAPIHILHLIPVLGSGGAETMLYKLLSRMDRDRFRSTVVSILELDELLAPKVAALGVSVVSLGLKGSLFDPRIIQRLLPVVRRAKPTILQTWMYHANGLGLSIAPLARMPKVVWNIRCSDLNFQNAALPLRLTFKAHGALARFTDAVIVNSAAGMESHRRSGHHAPRWELIPNGFDLDHFRPDPSVRQSERDSLGVKPEDLVIGMVARFHPFKDHATFIKAAKILRERHTNVVFVLVGRGMVRDNPEIYQQLERENLVDCTRLLGEKGDPAYILKCFDIATLCSHTEGFPNVLGEAMSSEVPCVASNVGDAALILGETGRIVPPRDPHAVADAWENLLLLGRAGRQELGRAARARVAERFSLDAVVRAYEDLYAELASSRARPA